MAKGTLTARPKPPSNEPETLSSPPASAGTASPKMANLQDLFLNYLRREKLPVTMFLVKGVKLQGIVTWFDNFSILLRRDGQSQLVYKHAISTVVPALSWLASFNVPSDWAAKPWAMDSPRPVPLPTSFVVKKGSVARASVASSMPRPISLTETQT